jgi:hypothetical protein
MCFSATANFVGSGGLAAIGVVTLTKVKHRRELLFAALPTMFAFHQFIEGFVWLGLDGILSPTVTHNMGAAFVLFAQGLLPFLLPLSVLLFEPNVRDRRRMLPFAILGGATALYMLWALTAYPLQVFVRGNSVVYINQGTNKTALALLYVIATCGSLFFFQDQGNRVIRRRELGDTSGCNGGEALRLHIALVRLCGGCKSDHPRLLLEEQHTPAAPLFIQLVKTKLKLAGPR